MIDRAKVIKGLECCVKGIMCPADCPYIDSCDVSTSYRFELLRDALELMKQENAERSAPARLLNVEELMDIKEPTLVWREDVDEFMSVIPQELLRCDVYDFGNGKRDMCLIFGEGVDPVDYVGNYVRFWSKKPTEQQRKEAKWDE